MSRNEKRHNQIFKIENCEKFNIKIIKNVEKFHCKIYATYSIKFTIFNHDMTRVKMTKFYHHNI